MSHPVFPVRNQECKILLKQRDTVGKTLRGTHIKDADDLAMYLLAQANVATVTGEAFGNPDCLRLSYATSEDVLTEAIKRIKEALA